jgi:AraC-like DNA-binding protein
LQTITHPPEKAWRHGERFDERNSGVGSGNRAVLARLAESLFSNCCAGSCSLDARPHGGWLAGPHDPQVGPVLILSMRSQTGHDSRSLQLNGVSRAALQNALSELVGESPIQYLAGWRMHLAQHSAARQYLGVAEIAGHVG